MKQISTLLSIVTIFLILNGCDPLNQDDYEEYIVIESYAIAGESYPSLIISKTVEAMSEFIQDDVVLSNATVQFSELDESGNPLNTINYVPVESAPGYYQPETSTDVIKEGTSYRFEIEIPEQDELITAQTTVPAQLNIVNDVPEEIVYQSENQLELVISKNNETSNNFFIFAATSLEPSEQNLTPFYNSILENSDDGEVTIEDFIISDSGLISENNFEVNDDGTITVNYPWLGVAFYGPNDIKTYSLDRNVFDLVRTQSVQLGGSTLSPGEIPNLIYNVEGAIGIFGSMSVDSVQTNFTRNN